MASNKRNVYFSKLEVRQVLSYEPITDPAIIKKEIFDRCEAHYKRAEQTGDYSLFQKKYGDEDEDVFTVSKLHYIKDCLCGIVGHGQPRIKRFLHERNPETFDEKELQPSEGHLFEEYSYFAISTRKLQLAYLDNSTVSRNIPALIISILRSCLDESLYEVNEQTMIDRDIKKKMRELGDKVVVSGVVLGQERNIIGGMQTLARLEKTMSTKFSARVQLRATLSKRLTPEEIEEITSSADGEDGLVSFSFANAHDEEKEVIDVIRRQVYFTKK